jgi:hypothetical protein
MSLSGPNSDPHAIVSALAEIENILNQAKSFSLFWGQNNGGGSPIQRLENVASNLCASIDNLSTQLDIVSQTLNRFIDSVECLPSVEAPVILMKKETGKRGAGSSAAGKKDRDSSTPDMPDSMHSNGDRKLANEVEES